VQHAPPGDFVNLDGHRIGCDVRNQSKRCVVVAPADAMHLTGRNAHATKYRPTIAHPLARQLVLRKAFKNLDPDFLRDRTFDPPHAIPEPDYFPLLLDVHWSPPKINQQEHNRNGNASR
jgi:hypothetical protein